MCGHTKPKEEENALREWRCLINKDAFSCRQRRMGWFKCICEGGRDQSRGHPMSFCFGTPGKSGGHAVRVMGASVCCPAKFKELGLLLCRGQTALHSSSLKAHEEGGNKKALQGPASSLLAHPLPLETRCVWQSKLGMRPTSKAENRIDKTRIIITPRHTAGRL